MNKEVKLSETDIKSMLEVETEERIFSINNITYATNKITVRETDMLVKDNVITLDDYIFESDNLKYKQITAYYDQVSAVYNIFVLAENENGATTVLKMKRSSTDSFNDVDWEDKYINNVTDLILVDCTEIVEPVGQTPLRYQVYALVDNELVLVD